jgi:uncharacterized protein (DUF433 family)
MDQLVTTDEEVAWGSTVIAGTRAPVATLFDYLEWGKGLDEFLVQFSTVSREEAIAILELARQRVSEPSR